jgi:hypothetical protein
MLDSGERGGVSSPHEMIEFMWFAPKGNAVKHFESEKDGVSLIRHL